MNGRDLTLGALAGLAVAGMVAQRRRSRGSRALASLPPATAKRFDELVELAPALYESIDDALWEDEDREGATDMLAEMLRANGFTVLGRGGSRVVVKLDGTYAAKVAAYDYGITQNQSESGTWGIVSLDYPEQAELLMPVHDLDGEDLVLLTEVAVPCKEKNAEACETAFREGFKKIESHSITRGLIDAEHMFNWGFHKGLFKLLDYGS